MFDLSFLEIELKIRRYEKQNNSDLEEVTYLPRSDKKWYHQSFFVHFLVGFVFTTLCVLYWASSWDIICYYIYPKSFLISIFITLIASQSLILISYLFQEVFQNFHDELLENWHFEWAFLMRKLHAYLLSLAYIGQCRSYWDTYNYYTDGVNEIYFFSISIFGIICYRYLLNNNFSSFNKSLPYAFVVDHNFDGFFLQGDSLKFKNKWIQRFCNYLNYEWVEMLIRMFVWKGVYGIIEQNIYFGLFSGDQAEYAFLTTAFIGYSIYLTLLISKNFLISNYKKNLIWILFLDFIDFIAYFSLVAIWQSVWNYFDDIVVKVGDYRGLFIVSTHFIMFFIFSILGVASNLYGPAGSNSDTPMADLVENLPTEISHLI